jgi:phosphocarrier protein HPr
MSSREASFEVINERGLHARAAGRLVELASSFPCEIQVAYAGQAANAKSVMGVLLLCGAKGAVLKFTAKGEGAEAALEKIGSLIAGRFGEEE